MSFNALSAKREKHTENVYRLFGCRRARVTRKRARTQVLIFLEQVLDPYRIVFEVQFDVDAVELQVLDLLPLDRLAVQRGFHRGVGWNTKGHVMSFQHRNAPKTDSKRICCGNVCNRNVVFRFVRRAVQLALGSDSDEPIFQKRPQHQILSPKSIPENMRSARE